MSKPSKRRFGAYKGEFEVPDSFLDPLPPEELAAFDGIEAETKKPEHPPAVVKPSSRRRSGSKSARKEPPS